jgi:hypothetical protein
VPIGYILYTLWTSVYIAYILDKFDVVQKRLRAAGLKLFINVMKDANFIRAGFEDAQNIVLVSYHCPFKNQMTILG